MSIAEVRVRGARGADLDAVMALERASTSAPRWAASVYAGILEEDKANAPRCLFIAERDAGVVGFAVGMMGPDGVGELESVVVADAARRVGIGRALCAAVMDWCGEQGATKIVLEVRAGSVGAIALYQGLGFVRAGRRARYYSDPEEDAVLMRLLIQ
jgi:[ribosomal protein S18]-alanine N-acetyltransferase